MISYQSFTLLRQRSDIDPGRRNQFQGFGRNQLPLCEQRKLGSKCSPTQSKW